MQTVILEDEALAARNLISILGEFSEINIIASLESIRDAVEWFSSNKEPDIVFMDIHLADGSAFEIFDRIELHCPVIFTTAYDEYALKAFKVNSIDYLLKPVTTDDIRKALKKLDNFSPGKTVQSDLKKLIDSFIKPVVFRSHFLVPAKGDKLIPLDTSEIAYLFIDAGIVKAVTYDNRSHSFEYTLDELVTMLNPDIFFRANRQFIINRSAIKDIDLWFNNRLSVNLKVPVSEKILVSKARITEFKIWFAGNR